MIFIRSPWLRNIIDTKVAQSFPSLTMKNNFTLKFQICELQNIIKCEMENQLHLRGNISVCGTIFN